MFSEILNVQSDRCPAANSPVLLDACACCSYQSDIDFQNKYVRCFFIACQRRLEECRKRIELEEASSKNSINSPV